MKMLPLTRGAYAMLDDDDFERAKVFKWCAIKTPAGKLYAHRAKSEENQYVSLHRFVVRAMPGEFVDHKSGNTLDNRRANLRVCTQQQNGWNRARDARNKYGFKGIYYWRPTNRWMAHIRVNDHKIHLGYFSCPEDAARAYDAAAIEHFGEFARTNFGQVTA